MGRRGDFENEMKTPEKEQDEEETGVEEAVNRELCLESEVHEEAMEPQG